MALRRCKAAFVVFEEGAMRVIREGDILDDSDPAYKTHKKSFEPLRVTNFPRSRAVEQASATPGEKRRRSRTEQGE